VAPGYCWAPAAAAAACISREASIFKWDSPKIRGMEARDRALHHLQQRSLRLVERNYRVAVDRDARTGEVDLILRERGGTQVFFEAPAQAGLSHDGAAATLTTVKQPRMIYATQH